MKVFEFNDFFQEKCCLRSSTELLKNNAEFCVVSNIFLEKNPAYTSFIISQLIEKINERIYAIISITNRRVALEF